MPQPNSHHLQSRVDQFYDHLYANATTRTPAGICAEVGKILHSGMYWEECKQKHPAFDYDRQQIRALIAQEAHTCRYVASQVREAYAEMNAAWSLYEPDSEISLNDLNIGYTVAQLSGLYLTDPKRDVFGDVIEIIRSNWAKRVGGQFFTDQRVTSLAMTLLDFDPRRGDDLVDICAGTGGFLLAGMNHIRALLDDATKPASEGTLIKLAVSSIKGLEVDEQIAGLANASLQSRLGTKSRTFVSRCDSLNIAELAKNDSGIRPGIHLCAASNPPFGTKITIKDPEVLREYDLAGIQARSNGFLIDGFGKLTPRAPDILFLEQNIRLLVPGSGRLAIVLPYQILSGPQTLFVREWLLQHAKVLAVIDLPNETFQPHTGTKTSLLVVKRRKEPLNNPRDDAEGSVFMAMPRWIGHDRRGHPVFRRNADGSLAEDVLSDFEEVKASYRAYQSGGNPRDVYDQCFAVPYKNLVTDGLLRVNALFNKPLNGASSSNGQGVFDVEDSGWKTIKIRDVVKRIFYPGRFRRDYVDPSPDAVPFLGGSNITELIATTDKWLRSDDPKLEALRVEKGWVLITRSGSTGIISCVPPAWDGSAMSEHVIRIVPDPAKLDPHYILAFLRTAYAQEVIKRGVFGSVIDEITPEFIGDIDMPVPASPKALEAIAGKVRKAEEARQKAIEGYVEALDILNKKLG